MLVAAAALVWGLLGSGGKTLGWDRRVGAGLYCVATGPGKDLDVGTKEEPDVVGVCLEVFYLLAVTAGLLLALAVSALALALSCVFGFCCRKRRERPNVSVCAGGCCCQVERHIARVGLRA